MPCEMCWSKDEQIRELEAKVRYLESQTEPMFPVRHINGRPFSELPKEEREHIEFAEKMGW